MVHVPVGSLRTFFHIVQHLSKGVELPGLKSLVPFEFANLVLQLPLRLSQ